MDLREYLPLAGKIAAVRDASMARWNNQLVRDGNLLGALGEIAFALNFGRPMPEPRMLLHGDGGRDFTVYGIGYDVHISRKISRDKGNLVHLVSRALTAADIVVAGSFRDPAHVVFQGWATGDEVLAAEQGPLWEGGPLYFKIPILRCRPMKFFPLPGGCNRRGRVEQR